jgi:hypothetical protein
MAKSLNVHVNYHKFKYYLFIVVKLENMYLKIKISTNVYQFSHDEKTISYDRSMSHLPIANNLWNVLRK